MNNKTKHILLFSSILLVLVLFITGLCIDLLLTGKIFLCIAGAIVAGIIIVYIWLETEMMIYGSSIETVIDKSKEENKCK